MNDDSLKGRIAALASETPEVEGGARVLNARIGGFAAMVNAIDETVLGERMTFSNGAAQMTVLVAGRRVAGLEEVKGIDVDKAILGSGLSMDNADQVKQIAQAMQSFSEDADKLTVMSEAMPQAEDLESVSLAALMSSIGVAPDDPTTPPMQRFMTRAADVMQASILLKDGAVSKTEGAIQLVQSLKIALSTQLPAFLDARKATCPSHTDPSLTLCHDTVDKGVGMAIAVHGDDLALLAFKTSDLTTICATWQRVS